MTHLLAQEAAVAHSYRDSGEICDLDMLLEQQHITKYNLNRVRDFTFSSGFSAATSSTLTDHPHSFDLSKHGGKHVLISRDFVAF
jgi:hypothetical protein